MEEHELANMRIVLDDEHAPVCPSRGGALGRGFLRCHRHSLNASPPPDPAPIAGVMNLSRPSHGSVKNGAVFTVTMKRKSLALLTLILATTISLGAYYSRRGDAAPALTTEAATRGSIVSVISATGTLQAVTTVQVGSQVSGIVESLKADFNSARHERARFSRRWIRSDYSSALEQARAALVGAEAEAERLRVAQSAADDGADPRARAVGEAAAARGGPASPPRPPAGSAAAIGHRRRRQDQAGPRRGADRAGEPGEDGHPSPIDGVVIARNVDVGQTVVGEHVRADAVHHRRGSVADAAQREHRRVGSRQRAGRISPSASASTRIRRTRSAARVSQVRLNPTTVQNVVTYAAIIDAPNPALKLKPGMTANVTIEVARRDNVLRVPAAALRFKPAADVLAQFGGRASRRPAGKSATVWVSNGTTIAPVAVTHRRERRRADRDRQGLVRGRGAGRDARGLDGRRDGRAGARDNGNPLMPAGRGGPRGR